MSVELKLKLESGKELELNESEIRELQGILETLFKVMNSLTLEKENNNELG